MFGEKLGLDVGYNKLLSLSNGDYLGTELKNIYIKLSNKQRGSKKYKKLLTHKKNETNRVCNSLKNYNIHTLYAEDLKSIKRKSKLHHKTNNKIQY